MSVTKRFLIIGGVAVGAALCIAAAAWACTPPSYIAVAGVASNPDVAVGVAGTEVRITGGVSATDANPLPIELHWRASNGQEIQHLKTIPAQTSYGAFSTTVQVPANATPGVYYVVAYAQNREDLGTASTAYRVVAPDTIGNGTGGSTLPNLQTSASTVGGSGAVVPGEYEPGTAARSSSPAAGDPSPAGARRLPPDWPGRQTQPASLAAVAAGQAVGAQPGSGADSQAGLATGDAPSVSAESSPVGLGLGGPRNRNIHGDLWSATAKAPSLGLALSSRLRQPVATAPLTLAIEVTSVGLGLLAVGFALGEVRRRRVLVHT